MTVTRYALGVVVSTTCLVTGVLWYDRARPEIRAEDVAACIAAGAERKWVTDWVPSTNTVTSTIKASDLLQAATLLRAAIINADVIYLDPGTWSDGGLDMNYGPIHSGQSWELVTNTVSGSWFPPTPRYWMDVRAKTSASNFINGVALADKAMPITVFTNTITLTTNQVYAVHTNLVIVSQTNTFPDWNAYGRMNGTVFVWNNDPYLGWCYTEAGINWDNSPIYHDYDGQWSTYTAWELWQPPAGSPVGTYVSPGGQPGSVEIDWHDSFVVTPWIITTNVTTTTIGGTNMPLYTALGMPANIPAWTNLVGGTNSWWAYAGFGSLPYLLQDVETISGRGRYTVETKNLAQLRKLATNMVRTVDFDFAVVGTNLVFSGDNGTNVYYAYDLDVAAGYAAIPGMIVGTTTTSAITSVTGVMAREDSSIYTYDEWWAGPYEYPSTNPAATSHIISIVTNQKYAAYSNLYIKTSTETTGPDWANTGRPVGTILYFDPASFQYNQSPTNRWTTVFLEQGSPGWRGCTIYYGDDQAYVWRTASGGEPWLGEIVGTYTPVGTNSSGSVEIAWHDSETIVPLITTTNYIWTFPLTRSYCDSYTSSRRTFSPTIPAAAFTNHYIARLRVYVAAETRSPYLYAAATNRISPYNGGTDTYEPLYFGENKSQSYGWDVVFGSVPGDQLPTQVVTPRPWDDIYHGGHNGGAIEVGYLTTNYVWSLVYDELNPTNVPNITIGADPFVNSTYFSSAEPPTLHNTNDDSSNGVGLPEIDKLFWRTCETRITRSALVIDWDFKLFGSTPYTPIEPNKPAWIP